MTVIGEFLRLVRSEHGLTQEQLVDQLSVSAKDFNALNTVTLSRWETGTTSPSYKKKRELLKFCAAQGYQTDGACCDFVRSRFARLCEPLSGIFHQNYKTLIANVPRLRIPLEEYDLLDLQQENDLLCFEHIVDIETASNPEGYYTVSPSTLQQLCRHPASFSLLCERKKQHLGHFVMFKLKSEAAERLVHRRLDENEVGEDDLCPKEEMGSYYIHALYGVNPILAALVNARAYLYLFDNKDVIDNICIFSSRPDGMRLARAYGIKTVARGKHKQCDFVWYGMQSPVEDILFSDTVLKLIF
jgi:transcriptional regulator with XRE-family HTH domain